MVKVISSREGGYIISFSENQTEEEWNLIRQAKLLEKKQAAEQYAKTVQPTMKGGIDWNFFRTGKRSQSAVQMAYSEKPTDGFDENGFLNPNEWITIISSEDWGR